MQKQRERSRREETEEDINEGGFVGLWNSMKYENVLNFFNGGV
jgi:hypothetical protein